MKPPRPSGERVGVRGLVRRGPMTDVTWITGYEEVREAFAHPALRQASYDGAKETIFADVLITLDGPLHLKRRRTELTLVRPDMVEALENRIIPADAAQLIATLTTSGEADLVDLARRLSTGMAARIVGLDGCDRLERLDRLVAVMARLHEGVIIEWSTRPRHEVLARTAEAREAYRAELFEPALQRREALIASGADLRGGTLDLLTLLLLHREDHPLDRDNLLRESVHFLVASAHTTATAISHALHEIWRWIAEHPEDAERLADPEFLQACTNEAIRLWPPSAWAFRIATADCALKSGRKVAAGEKVGLHLIQANRDPAVFGADPDSFRPERPTPARVAGYGLAFGGGPHVCLGRRLAAGAPGSPDTPGVVVAITAALLAAGCRPHPTQAPREQSGTERHQFNSYPVVFGPPLQPGARPAPPLQPIH